MTQYISLNNRNYMLQDKPTLEDILEVLETINYKYFGMYEMTEKQFEAIATLEQLALYYVKETEATT